MSNWNQALYSPPCITAAKRKRGSAQPQKEGWLRHQKNFAKPPKPTQPGWFSFCIHRKTTPASLEAARWRACASRRSEDAARHFIDRSATPCGDARRGISRFETLELFFHSSYERRISLIRDSRLS